MCMFNTFHLSVSLYVSFLFLDTSFALQNYAQGTDAFKWSFDGNSVRVSDISDLDLKIRYYSPGFDNSNDSISLYVEGINVKGFLLSNTTTNSLQIINLDDGASLPMYLGSDLSFKYQPSLRHQGYGYFVAQGNDNKTICVNTDSSLMLNQRNEALEMKTCLFGRGTM